MFDQVAQLIKKKNQKHKTEALLHPQPVRQRGTFKTNTYSD